jgi:diguanylate cyclase (GGDEF)-like protein
VLLHDRLREAIQSSGQRDQSFALLMIDLDGFKEVNDTFGHAYGDRLLQSIGPRLSQMLGEHDTVARLGGDEFAVLLDGADETQAVQFAEHLADVMRVPFVVDEYPLHVGASVGIAIHPRHGDDPDALLRRADVAMYVAKRAGDDYAIYSSDHDQHSADRLALIVGAAIGNRKRSVDPALPAQGRLQ